MSNNTNKKQWLSNSLFLERENWAPFLTFAVLPFLKKLEQKGLPFSYFVKFSYQSGENIQLAINIPYCDRLEVAKLTDQYFKSYFTKYNYPPFSRIPSFETIFAPYPYNTIQYGLFKVSGGLNKTQTHIRVENSRLIVEGLGENPIDDDLLTTFVLYAVFSIFISRQSSQNSIREYLSDKLIFFSDKKVDLGEIEQRYSGIRLELKEIFGILTEPSEALQWLFSWHDRLFALTTSDSTNDGFEFVKEVFDALFEQLAFNDFLTVLVVFCAYHTITSDVDHGE